MLDGNPSKAMNLCASGGGAKSGSILLAHRESGSGGASSASSTSFESSLSKSSQPKRDKKRSANALVDLTHSDDEDEEAPVASAYRGGGGSIATGGGLLGLSAASDPSKSSVFKYRLVPPINTGERERIKDIALLNALMVPTLDNKAMLTIKTTIDAIAEKYPDRVIKIGSSFVREVTTRTSSSQYPPNDYDRSLAVVFPVLFSNDSAGANAEGYGIAYAKERGICVNVRQEKEGSFGRNEKRGAAGDAGWSEGDPGCMYIAITRYCTTKDYHDNYLSYHYSCANYAPEDLDNNGRKIHVNSVTGKAGAMAYEEGRQLSSRHYDKETIASMSLSAPATMMPSHRARSESGRAISKPWTEQEDDALIDGVKLRGEGNWAQILADNHAVLNDRSDRAIRGRYETISGKVAAKLKAKNASLQRKTTVAGSLKRKRWTDDEENAVREGVRDFGKKWTVIKKKFPGRLKDRSPVHICTKYRQMSGK